jgi:hypothetical protein
VSCLIKQLQQQGFAEIVADLLGGMIGLLIETAKLVDQTVAGSDERHQGGVLMVAAHALMRGDALTLVEYLDGAGGEADLDLGANQAMGNAVVIPEGPWGAATDCAAIQRSLAASSDCITREGKKPPCAEGS